MSSFRISEIVDGGSTGMVRRTQDARLGLTGAL